MSGHQEAIRMDDLEKLKKRAPIIQKLAERGFFAKEEVEVLRHLGLLGQEVREDAQRW